MDQRIEDEKYIGELDSKMKSAWRASEYITREIISSEGLTENKATELGALYAAYTLEYWLHTGDLIRTAGQVPGAALGEVSAALFDAQRGDYKTLKKWVMEEALMSPKALGRRLRGIVRLIPNAGEPFKPPMPAWMDERFNGQGASQDE